MNFVRHSNLEGKHALLGASRYQWLNDDEEAVLKRMRSSYATDIGTILHAVAADRIRYGFKLSNGEKKSVLLELLKNNIPEIVASALEFDFIFENLKQYVNDAIGYMMKPEVVLYYSDYCFGTTDAIQYSEKNKFLRIHDLKTGTTPAHMEQLYIYEALFCLEYGIKPYEIEAECRIYQGGEIIFARPTVEDITPVMEKIISLSKFLETNNEREE